MAKLFSSSTNSSSTNAKKIQKQFNTYKANKTFKKQLTGAEKKQPTYKDAYKGYKNAVVNQLENGGFEFDAASSPVYQAYANDYRLLGNIAADQSAANIESLSGGYGTTYSGDVASQGLDSYLANEKAILPQLAQIERQNYQQDTANLINKGNLYNALESQDFAQFQDKLNRWNQNREYYYNKFLNDYQQSAKTHTSQRESENSTSNTTNTSVSFVQGRTGRSKSGRNYKVPQSASDSREKAASYLIGKGYGKYADNLLTRGEYVTARARGDRNYEAGYTGDNYKGLSDDEIKHRQKVEANVDKDYRLYLANYIKKALKGKK